MFSNTPLVKRSVCERSYSPPPSLPLETLSPYTVVLREPMGEHGQQHIRGGGGLGHSSALGIYLYGQSVPLRAKKTSESTSQDAQTPGHPGFSPPPIYIVNVEEGGGGSKPGWARVYATCDVGTVKS
jgi:hypothetical protein